MPQRSPLTLKQLHALGVRCREDPDVKVLLWEIKRLHEALADAGELFEPLPKVAWNTPQFQKWKALAQVIAASGAIVRPRERQSDRFDLSLPDTLPRRRKVERGPVNGYAQRRVAQVAEDELSEREAKRRARHRRG